MIPQPDAILVDSCDPVYPDLHDFATWQKIKRRLSFDATIIYMFNYLKIISLRGPLDAAQLQTAIEEVKCGKSTT